MDLCFVPVFWIHLRPGCCFLSFLFAWFLCRFVFFPSCPFFCFVFGGNIGRWRPRWPWLSSAALEGPRNGCTLKGRLLFCYRKGNIVKTQFVFLQRPPPTCCQGQRDLNYFNLWCHTTVSEKPWETHNRYLMTSWDLLKLKLFVYICLSLLDTARNFTLGLWQYE